MPRGHSPLQREGFIEELMQFIEVGNYVTTACQAMGITSAAYYQWLGWGREVEVMLEGREDAEELKEYLRERELEVPMERLGVTEVKALSWYFLQEANRCSARSEAFAVAQVRKHMPDQWTAAMTFLERRFPSRWKRKEQIDIGEAAETAGGIDETLLLEDPEAIKLVHDALVKVSNQPLLDDPRVIDATVVEDDIGKVEVPGQDDKSPPPA